MEHSRALAEGVDDPCVALLGQQPLLGPLATAGRHAGWSPEAVLPAFVVAQACRFIVMAEHLGFLPRVEPGDPALELRWSDARAVLSSFGYAAWDQLAMLACATVPTCPFVSDEPASDWFDNALKARTSSGVPLSFARIPWRAWRDAPDVYWLKLAVLWHVVRHAYVAADGEHLRTFYKSAGTATRFENANSFLAGPLIDALRRGLQLPKPGTKKEPNPLGDACAEVLARLTPAMLLRQRRPRMLDPHIMPGPHARLVPYRVDDPHIEHSCVLEGVAVCLDGLPSLVTPDQQQAEDVLAWDWQMPTDDTTESRHVAWLSALPEVAPDGRPSELLRAAFPNLTFLDDDHACLLDAVFVCDMVRRRGGHPLLGREFPLVTVLPHTPTVQGSTNTGKTALVDVMAQCFASQAKSLQVADSSAPTRRSIATSIEHFGFVALDEFKMPAENSDHPLNRQALQTLCTGGSILCGKVMSNEEHHVQLTSSIILNAKYLQLPDDMLLRSIFLWLEPRSGGDPTAIKQRWDRIVSGRLGIDLRLASLRMLDQWPDIDDFEGHAPSENQWRMVAHRMCAARICARVNGVDLPTALARIDDVVRRQIDEHQVLTQAAIDSGLVGRYESASVGTIDIGELFLSIGVSSDPKHRYDQLNTLILQAKAAAGTHVMRGGAVGPGYFVRAFRDYYRARDPQLAGRSTPDIFGGVLGARFAGLTEKQLIQRVGEAMCAACPRTGARWPLPEMFGYDGWYLERQDSADGRHHFLIAQNQPKPNP